MPFDQHKNFAISTVTAAPGVPSSGTSITVENGSIFPTPPFNATVWANGEMPVNSNAEIVRVTAIAGNVMTIVRAQELSTARAILVTDQIAATITAKTLTDVETALGALSSQKEPKSFLVGTTVGAPTAGASTWVNSDFANSYVVLFLNGAKVYHSDLGNGAPYITKVLASTTLTINNYSGGWVAGDIVEYILITP